jgi:hypothetical protein
MIRGRYRWPIRIAILLIAGLALLLWAIAERSRNRLAIENRSGQPITSLRVTVAGKTQTFEDVRVGTEVTVPLALKPGDRFSFEGTLADGSRIRMSGVAGEQSRFVALPGGQIIPRPSGKAAR